MPLKYKCKGCGNLIVTKYLKPGDVAKCRSCGTENVVPAEAIETEEKPIYLVNTPQPSGLPEKEVSSSKTKSFQCQIYDKSDYAGFWRRFSAHFLDGLVLSALFAIARLTLDELGWLIMSYFSLVYLLGMKALRGGTLSYLLLGIKIVSIDGKEASFRQIVIRAISTIFSILSVGLGFLWIALDKHKQAWHDKIAGTYVIVEDAKPVSTFQIERRHPIRTRLFVLLSLPLLPFVMLCVPGSILLMKLWTSEPYQMAKKYAKESPEIRAEIGEIKAISAGFGNIWGDSADFKFLLIGEKKKAVRFESILIKREKRWEFKRAVYVDQDSNVVVLKDAG